MSTKPPLLAKLFLTLAARSSDQRFVVEDLREEFETMLAEGSSPAHARRWYWRQVLGSVPALLSSEIARTVSLGTWLDRLVMDVRFGVRSLVRAPGFALVAILTLGLGVGVTTAMFTVVNGVLFRPLPFFEPDRLVALSIGPENASWGSLVEDRHFLELRRQSSPFARMSTFDGSGLATLTGAGEPVGLNAASVTAEFLDVLGVPAVLGRGFSLGDDQTGASPVVVLGNALWRSRFGADANVVGTTATLDGVSRSIVGVMPPGFDFPNRADLWLPLDVQVEPGHSYPRPVVARLEGGVTVDQATAELSAAGLEWSWDSNVNLSVRVDPLRDLVVGESRYPLLIFTVAVALVLLISCTNVANLLLMRAVTREREIGLRRVLGAGKARLIRQLLTESVMIALLGGGVGIFFAMGGVEVLLALAPPGTIPRGQEIHIDLAVLAFTLGISAFTGVAFGLAPAFKVARRELRDTIAEGARTHSPRRGLARGVLVVAEVGLAVVLLTGAGLFLRSLQQIRAIDLGFRPESTLAFVVDLPESSYPGGESMAALHFRVLEGLEQIPGVDVAGAANRGPLVPSRGATRFSVVDATGATSYARAAELVVSPAYFRAMGIALLSGRGLTAQDDPAMPGVIVVNKSMAEQFWPNRDPIGQRLTIRSIDVSIVGVVENVVGDDILATPGPAFYLPIAQEVDRAWQLSHMSYVVRASASPRGVAPAMRAALWDADPNLAPGSMSTLDDLMMASVGDRVFQTRVLGVFAVLALLLAAVGIYGVTAYSVSERTREIGVRMALGARAGDVAGMTLGHVLKLVIPGLVLGSVVGLAATRLLAASLYEVTPTDPVTIVGVAVLLGGVAIAAALVPTARAARVDPMAALRLE